PATAILHGSDGSAVVQIVRAGTIVTRRIKTGLTAGTQVEVVDGLAEGDIVAARSGTFLREGDAVRPLFEVPAKTSESRS
ncbi:MAG: efflux transporter periplasmic adaptor subunit, partial [Hyphomicrobiaceae bacterium]